MSKETTFSRNLKLLRNKKGKSQQEVADSLSIKRRLIAEYETGASQPKIEGLMNLAKYYNVTAEELWDSELWGVKLPVKSPRTVMFTIDKEYNANIELVQQKARAGYTSSYMDEDFVATLPKIFLPDMPSGNYRAFEIQGDSMPPIGDGSIVIGRYVPEWSELINDRYYVLVTSQDGVVFKKIKNNVINRRTLTLISNNELYKEYEFPIEELLEAWEFYSFIGFDVDPKNESISNILEKLSSIDDKINQIIVHP